MSVKPATGSLKPQPNNQNPKPGFDESIQKTKDPEKPSIQMARAIYNKYKEQYDAMTGKIVAAQNQAEPLKCELQNVNTGIEICRKQLSELDPQIQKALGGIWDKNEKKWSYSTNSGLTPNPKNIPLAQQLKTQYAQLAARLKALEQKKRELEQSPLLAAAYQSSDAHAKLAGKLRRAEQQVEAMKCAEKIDADFHGGVAKHPIHKEVVLHLYDADIQPGGTATLLTETKSHPANKHPYEPAKVWDPPQPKKEIYLQTRSYNYKNGELTLEVEHKTIDWKNKIPSKVVQYTVDVNTCTVTQKGAPYYPDQK